MKAIAGMFLALLSASSAVAEQITHEHTFVVDAAWERSVEAMTASPALRKTLAEHTPEFVSVQLYYPAGYAVSTVKLVQAPSVRILSVTQAWRKEEGTTFKLSVHADVPIPDLKFLSKTAAQVARVRLKAELERQEALLRQAIAAFAAEQADADHQAK
jgi:hypothetical protein